LWIIAEPESDNAMTFIRDILDLEGLERLTQNERYTLEWSNFVELMRSSWFSQNYYAIGELDPLGAKVLVDVTSNIFRQDAKGTIFEPMTSLETLVSTLSTFESSDPRDTIHALQNIVKETPMVSSPKTHAAVIPHRRQTIPLGGKGHLFCRTLTLRHTA
jgi:hypothetical protein